MFRKRDGEHDRVLASGPAEARRAFGGLDLPAAVAGTYASIGFAVLIGGIAAGIMAIAHDRGATTEDLSRASVITGLVALVLAAYVGGWVAGRMARYDGMRNATLSVVLFALLTGAASGIAAWLHRSHDVARGVTFPDWLEYPSATSVLGISAALLVAGLAMAWLGGAVGARYHRRADAVVATPPPGVVQGEAEIDLTSSEHAGRQAVL